MNILYRKNSLFVIDENTIISKGRTPAIKAALYSAVYQEFLGAIENPKYRDLKTLDRFNKLNDFATAWLKDRGLLNG